MDCIFCKIIKGEIPSHQAYKDDKVMAFLDILPISPGHTIVVPKRHINDFESLTNEELSAMMQLVKNVGHAMLEGLGAKGYSFFLDNKSAANQHVPHVHFHIVPRVEGDGLERWPQSGYEDGQADKVIKKLTSKL